MGKGAQLHRATVNIKKAARSPDSQSRAPAECVPVPSKTLITTASSAAVGGASEQAGSLNPSLHTGDRRQFSRYGRLMASPPFRLEGDRKAA